MGRILPRDRAWVVGWEGESLSCGDTADSPSEGRPCAICFSNTHGISEAELGWSLSPEKEERKADGCKKGKKHPSAAQRSWL